MRTVISVKGWSNTICGQCIVAKANIRPSRSKVESDSTPPLSGSQSGVDPASPSFYNLSSTALFLLLLQWLPSYSVDRLWPHPKSK
ncbi:hypothetical protein IG631_04763 [Alternaria alternata]|nr:hypothetical protein IG631_04763 [Alternaria alternata]